LHYHLGSLWSATLLGSELPTTNRPLTCETGVSDFRSFLELDRARVLSDLGKLLMEPIGVFCAALSEDGTPQAEQAVGIARVAAKVFAEVDAKDAEPLQDHLT
jgi:hypothetical protein